MTETAWPVDSCAPRRTPEEMPSTTRQFIQHLPGRDEIRGAETLGKLVVDRLEKGDGKSRSTLNSQQSGEAGHGAQLPGQRTLAACLNLCLAKQLFGGFGGARASLHQQEFALEA